MEERVTLRGDNSTVEYPLFQTECGGSSPTSPLHLHIYEIPVPKAIRLNSLWHSRLPKMHESNILRTIHRVCYAAAYENQYFGVAIWTDPVARKLDGLTLLELRRLAISNAAPQNTATRMLRVMRGMIARKFPNIERLISYQDTEVHTGTIYKAAGWQIGNVSRQGDTWDRPNRHRVNINGDATIASAKIRWEMPIKKRPQTLSE